MERSIISSKRSWKKAFVMEKDEDTFLRSFESAAALYVESLLFPVAIFQQIEFLER